MNDDVSEAEAYCPMDEDEWRESFSCLEDKYANAIARIRELEAELEAGRASERSVRVKVFRYLDSDYIWVEMPDGTSDNIIADNPIARLLAANLPAGPDSQRTVEIVVREIKNETKGR